MQPQALLVVSDRHDMIQKSEWYHVFLYGQRGNQKMKKYL